MIPLDQLGLYYMLERIHKGTANVNDFIRVGMFQAGLIDDSDPPQLTEAGKHKLQALRSLLSPVNDAEPLAE